MILVGTLIFLAVAIPSVMLIGSAIFIIDQERTRRNQREVIDWESDDDEYVAL